MQGSGISSESIWTPFDSVVTATVRPVRAKLYVAWNRIINVENYAVIGTSLINGTDIIQGLTTALTSADDFEYFDETNKVIRLEYERHLIEPLGGISIAMADVILDNTDLRFTPDYNSTIGTALRPNRPLKMFIGFEVRGISKTIPIIEGLTLQPKENKAERTVKISIFDFIRALNKKPQETAIYTNQRSDQIIADILARAGVGSANYQLDEGLNTVGFAWFEKGETAGDRIRKLCEAEEAIFFQDEQGILRFETRDRYSRTPYNTPVWDLEPDDILEWYEDRSSEIINRAIIHGAPRSVKGESEIWKDGIEEEVEPGATITIWAEFEDPVSSITSPADSTDMTAFTGSGGAGSNITSDIEIILTSFTKSAKLEITNNNASKAYINFLRLRGTPATVDYEIKEVFQDTDSIDNFNEQQREIRNQFIDKRVFAANMAQNIVRRHKNPTSVLRLKIRGVPQLQLRDQIRVKDQDLDVYTNYRIISIQGVFEAGSFTQTLRLREITSNEAL